MTFARTSCTNVPLLQQTSRSFFAASYSCVPALHQRHTPTVVVGSSRSLSFLLSCPPLAPR